ncbi:MAG: aminodeoxychorismate synthase component I [Desulfobulbaceae bacterium]|nr:aminodeoxychorismate synthase component I [Desulfobulbaceae bacterium]
MLGVFEDPLVYDHASETFTGGSGWPGPEITREQAFAITDVLTNISRGEYLEAIERIQEYIKAGDTYQVNYTLKLNFDFTGSKAALYRALRRNQSVSYSAWIRHGGRDIMSFSPELFFHADGKCLRVRPMKGTMSRGRTVEEDEQYGKRLQKDEKNRSENIMIVDLLRNDLARLLHNVGGGRVEPGSLFDVETYQRLLQMTSTIDGIFTSSDRQPGMHPILSALFPCGSVTGAPKIRTMEIIHELEKERRGVYCGAIGYAGPARAMFNVPIRTLELEYDKGAMGIGSGIVHDSDPADEWRECLLKGNFLTHPRPEFQLIETLFWHPVDGYQLMEEHLDRLAASAAYFLYPCDIPTIRQQFADLVQPTWTTGKRAGETPGKRAGETPGKRVRLLLHADGQVEISAYPLPDLMLQISVEARIEDPLPVVMFSGVKTDPADIYLYHKTTMRRLYTEEGERIRAKGGFEVLFTNTRDELTEGSISNVFIQTGGKLFTPPITSGLLGGTFRRFMLDQGRVREKVLTRLDVIGADKVYVANSLRGLVQVQVQDG